MWNQLSPRVDDQIRTQEMLAVALLIGTFPDILSGSLVRVVIDDDGVRHALQRGTGGAPEVAPLVGILWLHAAETRTVWYAARVESKANIADGPTRYDL